MALQDSEKELGMDWSADNIYDAVRRPDLKPKETTYEGSSGSYLQNRFYEILSDYYPNDHQLCKLDQKNWLLAFRLEKVAMELK